MSQNKSNTVVSIQSMVSYGYVGNSMFNFAVQLHGIDSISIPTVIYSSHAEQNVYYGQKVSGGLFSDLIKGTRETQVDLQASYVVSGYINSVEILELTKNYIVQYKEQQPLGKYIYDPVFGDKRADGLYIEPKVANASLDLLLPICDILTPNHFEIEYILGCKISNCTMLGNLIEKDLVLREKCIIVTDACFSDTAQDKIEVVLIYKSKLTRFYTDKISIAAVGTGDLFTAILCASLINESSVEKAIQRAMDFIGITLTQTVARDKKQICAQALLYAKTHLDG